MKPMKKMLAVLLCGILVFSGCSEVPDDPGKVPDTMYKEYLIDVYVVPEQLTLVGVSNEVYFSITGSQYAYWHKGAKLAEFLRLAALHGGRIDREVTLFPEYYWFANGDYACYSEDFASINVTCDEPWDETHPVGSSLNEFFTVTFSTFAPYVRNGNSGPEVVRVEKRMDTLEEGDLDMIVFGTLRVEMVSVKHFPEPFQFTMTLTTKSGQPLSVSWSY